MTTTRSRLRSILMACAVALAALALQPGTALAHGDHADDWMNCFDSATAGVEQGSGSGEGGADVGGDETVSSDDESGQEPVMCAAVPEGAAETYSGGSPGRGGMARRPGAAGVAAACPSGSGGAGGSTGQLGASAPWPDSSNADLDVDSGSADVGGDLVGGSGVMRSAGWTSTGLRRVVAAGCVRPLARIGGLGDEVLAPTRIDAGAGGAAAGAAVGASASAAGVIGAGGLAAIAAAAARRRRTLLSRQG